MQYQQPYIVRQPPPRRVLTTRRSLLGRYLIYGLGTLVGLIVLATGITLLIVYFNRYRIRFPNYLSYPNFICAQRPCGCPNYNNGKELLVEKIVGGQEAPPFTYPWLVALTDRYGLDPFCAGFIISSNTILTAAHCLRGRNPSQVQILARAHDLRRFNGERHDINNWLIHPEYRINNQSMHLNDIALVRMYGNFASDLRPVCLPTDSSFRYPQAKTTAVVGGWGKPLATPTTRNSPVLQHVVMPIVDNTNIKCRQSIADIQRQLCAGYDNISADTCAGDSGAPLLVVERNGNGGYFVAAGIVSYGNKQCDASISSGVYTRVNFYLKWIDSSLKQL